MSTIGLLHNPIHMQLGMLIIFEMTAHAAELIDEPQKLRNAGGRMIQRLAVAVGMRKQI